MTEKTQPQFCGLFLNSFPGEIICINLQVEHVEEENLGCCLEVVQFTSVNTEER